MRKYFRNILRRCLFLFLATSAALPMGGAAQAAPARYVIQISVDGLRSDAVTALGPQEAPNFYRFRDQGAWTDNARTDFDFTITLPNHTSQLTGRGVSGATGHNWTANSINDVPVGMTLHTNKGSYVASVFDVAHDNGLNTALFTGKDKFILYDQSYGPMTGAPDQTGADNGRDKIDLFVYEADSEKMTNLYVAVMKAQPFRYSFVHFPDPDRAGHAHTWDVTEPPRSPYLDAVRRVDKDLGQIFGLVESTPALRGQTAIVLTADHGGMAGTKGHGDVTSPQDYTIPFYVWGASVTHGDLYLLNADTHRNPGTRRPSYDDAVQPIRDGDAANVALGLLDLKPVPGSTIGVRNGMQSLRLHLPLF